MVSNKTLHRKQQKRRGNLTKLSCLQSGYSAAVCALIVLFQTHCAKQFQCANVYSHTEPQSRQCRIPNIVK